jgi:WD40 repeat protein
MGTPFPGRGEAVEGYEVLSELGRGAMGVVWLARDRSLDRLVALKLIAVSDPRLQQRLMREGRAAAQLRHPNIVAVHSLGGIGPSTYLAMEFIEGGDLGAQLRGKPMPSGTAAGIATKLAGALAHAHAAGLLHRDIKPSNVLMDVGGEPKLADFGLAAPLEGGGDLTNPGAIAGTPAYLAPELLAGSEHASAKSDIYGLGAVLYTCLTGRPPFVGASTAAVLAQLPDSDPIPPHLLQPGVPKDLETICMKCLEKAPDRRYASAVLLQADLDAFLLGEPIAARPVGRVEWTARYFRRRPALAISTGAAVTLLLALAIGGPLMALRLARSQRAAVAAQARAEHAEAETLERLRESLLTRSRATRLAGGRGQRDDALSAATEAAQIRKGLDARDEVIAALARPEIVRKKDLEIKAVGEGRVSFDPDNDRYVVEVALGQLELRKLSDGSLIQNLSGPPSKLWSKPVFSPDGRLVAARNEKAEEIVWNDQAQTPAFVLEDRAYVLTGRYSEYGSPEAFSPDGLTLASSLPAGGVSFHATSNGREIRRIPTGAVITHLAYSWNGRWLAVGRGLRPSSGGTASLSLFDASDDREITKLPIDASYQTVAWSADSSRVMTGGEELRIFSAPEGIPVARLSDPLALKAFFGPGGTTVVSSATSGQVTLWNLGKARPLLIADIGAGPVISVSRDGTEIAKSIGDEGARIYSLEMSPVTRSLPTGSGLMRDNVLSAAVSVIDYSPDGRWLATAVWGAVQLRDCDGNIVSVAEQGDDSNYCSVHFTRDGRSLLASSRELGLVRLPLDFSDGRIPRIGPGISIDPEKGYYIADASRDGTRVALTAFVDGKAKVVWLDGTSPTLRWAVDGAAGAAFLGKDSQIVVNSLNDDNGAFLELRDAHTGEKIRTMNFRHGAHAHASADGAWVVLGEGENKSSLVRTADWSPGPALPKEIQGRGSQPAFSPDGTLLAVGVESVVHLVRVSDGSVVAHLQSPQTGTYLPGLTFSPDGSHLALWWENGQLTLWDLHGLRLELAKRGLDW